MSHLPHQLYTSAQVRRLDEIAISEFGLNAYRLMERAGSVAFAVLYKRWPAARKIAVFCGVGNNGGDGFVLARLAAEAGMAVQLYQVGDAGKIKGEALTAREALPAEVPCEAYSDQNLADFDMVVDGLLGTGLSGDVSPAWAAVIDQINGSGKPVLALDIPSGLDGDSGHILGTSIKAAITVTFIGLKQGLFTGAGPGYTGKVVFNDLQVPAAVYAGVPVASWRMHSGLLGRCLPARAAIAHKGDFGHVLVVGGNVGMSGAATMAAEAAARVGAGLVSLATRKENVQQCATKRPEIMVRGVSEETELSDLLTAATVVAIGPGLGQDQWAKDVLEWALSCPKPKVLDADALNLLAQDPQQRQDWILTPHPGEAARLLQSDTPAIQQNRFKAITDMQQRYGGVLVLKGAGTLVINADASIHLCSAGNPGMASGGMGDVLTGTIAGLLAQGLSLDDAAQCGVYIHALAGDRAAKEGVRGLLATDLMPHIRFYANPARH